MKKNIKRLALLITLVMLVQAIFVGVFTVNASAALGGNFTGYTKASDVQYNTSSEGYIANWGARGEVATFLTTNALSFSSGSYAFDTVSKLGGGATESAVPGSDLYKKLQDLMKSNHDYITSYDATKNLFKYTDCVNGNPSGGISSFYSGNKIGPSWDGAWNREHTWPNTKGDLAGSGENDLMMLRPTASSENGARGNKAYGQSSGYYNPNSESGGLYDLRGDVARLSLYTYVRWGCINTGSGYNPNGIFGQAGIFESLDVLLSWIKADPVDTWELGRNDSVESITGTRNVFVDYPEYAFLLFGKEVPTDMVTPSSAASLGVQGGTPSTGGGTGTTPSTPTLNAVKPVVGTAYKLGMNQTYAGKIVYMLGTESGYYLATTETMTSGLDFYIEETTGGYYIYTTINGAKQYLDMVPSGEHVNAKYVSTPTVVYTWNDTLKTFVGNVNSVDYVFGTRNDNSYVTVGCNKVSYDPFVVQFVPADGSSNPGSNPGTNPDNPTPPAGNTNGLADAVKPVVGKDYKLAMNQTLAGKVVYLLGSENGYYLATTVNKDHGLIFNIEETTGGYYIYTMINGAKKYLDMGPTDDGAHVNAKYVDTPSTVYTWNETYKTFVGNVGGDEYAFGTRNDKNYETVGCNKLSYEPFVLQFLEVAGENQGDQGGSDNGGNNQGGSDNGGNNQGGSDNGGNNQGGTTETPADTTTKSGCGSAIGGISAVIIALIIPFMFFKKKEDEE